MSVVDTSIIEKLELNTWYSAKQIGIHGSTAASWARKGLLERKEGAVPALYRRPEKLINIDAQVDAEMRRQNTPFVTIYFKARQLPMLCMTEGGVLVDSYRHRFTAEMYKDIEAYQVGKSEKVYIK